MSHYLQPILVGSMVLYLCIGIRKALVDYRKGPNGDFRNDQAFDGYVYAQYGVVKKILFWPFS
jgi:hypothetical protein